MKKLLFVVLALFIGIASAFADTCSVKLMPTFVGAQATKLCATFLGTSTVSANIIPGTDNAYDLGSATFEFNDLFLGGNLQFGSTNSGNIIMPKAQTGAIIGETARAANVTTAIGTPNLYISGNNSANNAIAFIGSGATTNGSILSFFKTRATSGQASTIVNSGDSLGQVTFWGANGTTYDQGAVILATVDATPGAAADMPGALDFQVSPDGSATVASVLKLKNDKSANFTGAIKSTATNLGWQARAAANTACNTTCTAAHGCVFGYDIGTTALVDCTSALADSCICTF